MEKKIRIIDNNYYSLYDTANAIITICKMQILTKQKDNYDEFMSFYVKFVVVLRNIILRKFGDEDIKVLAHENKTIICVSERGFEFLLSLYANYKTTW